MEHENHGSSYLKIISYVPAKALSNKSILNKLQPSATNQKADVSAMTRIRSPSDDSKISFAFTATCRRKDLPVSTKKENEKDAKYKKICAATFPGYRSAAAKI